MCLTPTLKATTPPITGAVAVLPSAAQACRKEVAFRDNEVVEIQGLRFDGVGLLGLGFSFLCGWSFIVALHDWVWLWCRLCTDFLHAVLSAD